jgi:hypothetical protein
LLFLTAYLVTLDCKLKAEKDSLANAKMIIASLEEASKSMMEDKQSKLKDNNIAIASLLDKSLENNLSVSIL